MRKLTLFGDLALHFDLPRWKLARSAGSRLEHFR